MREHRWKTRWRGCIWLCLAVDRPFAANLKSHLPLNARHYSCQLRHKPNFRHSPAETQTFEHTTSTGTEYIAGTAASRDTTAPTSPAGAGATPRSVASPCPVLYVLSCTLHPDYPSLLLLPPTVNCVLIAPVRPPAFIALARSRSPLLTACA